MSDYQRVKPFLLITGLQSGSSTSSGGGGTQSTSSNLSQHLTYTSYILKQTPQVSGISISVRADWQFISGCSGARWMSCSSVVHETFLGLGSRSSLTTLVSLPSARHLLYHLLLLLAHLCPSPPLAGLYPHGSLQAEKAALSKARVSSGWRRDSVW